MKNKKILIAIIVILALILLFPVPMRLKDGGSIKFQAALYSITKYHQLNHETESGYDDGIGVEILGVEIVNTTGYDYAPPVESNTEQDNIVLPSEFKTILQSVDVKSPCDACSQ